MPAHNTAIVMAKAARNRRIEMVLLSGLRKKRTAGPRGFAAGRERRQSLQLR
jgi:hypothetical protein